jgi:hypothetical protein
MIIVTIVPISLVWTITAVGSDHPTNHLLPLDVKELTLCPVWPDFYSLVSEKY